MATFTIITRNAGEVKFVCRDQLSYVRIFGADLGELDGKQICAGGSTSGQTLMADASSLERVARKWWNDYLRNQRALFVA
jgi:hypothetical protein